MNILVLSAHADDETLGMGGTIARLTQEGHEVYVAAFTDGVGARGPAGENAVWRNVHFRAALTTLGAGLWAPGEPLPDNAMDTVPLLSICKKVEAAIRQTCPEVVYVHSGGDLNIDHSLLFRAALTATRPQPGCTVKEVYAYEVPSSTEWGFQRLEPVFRPNVFVDITGTLDTKVKALMCYENEVRAWPHPRSPEAIRAMAQRWGSVAGYEAAEAFELIRKVR